MSFWLGSEQRIVQMPKKWLSVNLINHTLNKFLLIGLQRLDDSQTDRSAIGVCSAKFDLAS